MIYDELDATNPPESRRRSERRHSAEHRKKRAWEKEKNKMETELQSLKNTNERLERQFTAAQTNIQILEDEVNRLKTLASRYEADLQAARDENSNLGGQSKRQSDELKMLKTELRAAEAHHDQTRHLLGERTKELSGAQKFLTQADSLAGADVIAIVEALNAEILQAAASMAESLDFTGTPRVVEAQQKAYKNVAHTLGPEMMEILVSSSRKSASEFDATPVQLALQICMARCCGRIAECWFMSEDGRLDQGLKEIHNRMCEKGTLNLVHVHFY